MSEIVLTKVLVLLFLLLCSGFFSGSETSLFSLGRLERHRIRTEGKGYISTCLLYLLERPRRLIITVLIGNELVNITVSALSASLLDDAFSAWVSLDLPHQVFLKTIAATAICFPLLLIFGEATPKTLALSYPIYFGRMVSIPLRLFYTLMTPVRWILAHLASAIVRLVLGETPPSDPSITEAEFRNLVDLSKNGGVLWESERELIHNIFEFGDTRVSEVMTPRTDMFCIQTGQSLEEILQAIEKQPFSRIPVYEKDKDDIVGILYCKDILGLPMDPVHRGEWDLGAFLRKPYFIPQTKKASDLFREFRFSRIHLAIVVDEYGGVAGLVTMEDLLEEIFGEILDEYDPEEPKARQVNETTIIIPARMSIEEFNRRVGAELPVEEHDTMGGLVFDLFGRLPPAGAKVSYMRYTFTVEKMLGTRILELRVEWHPRTAAQSEPGEPGPPPRTEGQREA